MSWITVADIDAMPSNSPERQMVLKIKAVDDLADIVAEGTETFRDAIRSSGQPLDVAGTIPLSLKRYVLAWAVWEFVSRGVAKNAAIQTDARKSAAAAAEKILERIMEGKLKVSAPDPTQTITLGVSLLRPGRRVRTNSFDKLGET